MTQEELDALMSGEIHSQLKTQLAGAYASPGGVDFEPQIESDDYRVDSNVVWPPPPPNTEHKVVNQLDDVTKDSEKKATEMVERLESITKIFDKCEAALRELNASFDKNIDLFSRLHKNFPNISTFEQALAENQAVKDRAKSLVQKLQAGQDEVIMSLDAMQYQDIHRQKIERVINVMRALSRYMTSLFEGKIDDKSRVSTAVHIEGDSTDDLVNNDEIEALIAKLGKK